ncbi:defense protein l(2)34Fc-like [Gigantopelta aegis]|uniref:defense protein l(2)34Fc-like n=1 Tax=Gigantopelta aegis TaxID=1735272 RepID=UPI001B889ED2|nr:defense protein l(2)34Fc-like [Gigantopelta aegis]
MIHYYRRSRRMLVPSPAVGVFLLFVAVCEVTARKDGAPSSACDSMTPSHGSSGRTDQPPFSLSVSTSTYTPGSILSVTLRREGAGTFKGFLVQIRTADPTKDQSTRYGQFSAGSNSRTQCSGGAITHVINDDKTEVTFTWTAPATDQGDLQFRTTYVQQFSSYWIGVKSAIIKPYTPSTSSTQTASTLSTSSPASTELITSTADTDSSGNTDKTSATTSTKSSVIGDGDNGTCDVKPIISLIVLAFAIFLRL